MSRRKHRRPKFLSLVEAELEARAEIIEAEQQQQPQPKKETPHDVER